jgi:hypothetical protein
VLLNEADSLDLWKAKEDGSEKVFLTRGGLVEDGGEIKIFASNSTNITLETYPVKPRTSVRADTIFQEIFKSKPEVENPKVSIQLLKPAGPAREIPLSTGKSRIAIAPNDADFTNAAVWKITLPSDWSAGLRPGSDSTNTPDRKPALLRIRYLGDVARLTLNGKLIADNFYAGREFDLGLNRYAPEIFTGELRLEILPLRKDAPIFIEPKDRPDFGTNETLVKLQSVEVVNFHEIEFKK